MSAATTVASIGTSIGTSAGRWQRSCKNQQLAREEAERRTRAQQQEREARSRRERENSAQRDSGDSPACQQARRRLDTMRNTLQCEMGAEGGSGCGLLHGGVAQAQAQLGLQALVAQAA